MLLARLDESFDGWVFLCVLMALRSLCPTAFKWLIFKTIARSRCVYQGLSQMNDLMTPSIGLHLAFLMTWVLSCLVHLPSHFLSLINDGYF